MLNKRGKKSIVIPNWLLLTLFIGICAGIWFTTRDRHPQQMRELFKKHHKELEEIVKRVKKTSIPLDEARYYRVNTRFDPDTLARTDLLHEDGFIVDTGKVGAYHNAENQYIITIVLSGEGSNMYGVMYSDSPINTTNNVQWTIERAVPLIFCGQKIEDHWWYAYNTLHE